MSKKNSKKIKVIKLIIFMLAIVTMIGLTIYLFPVVKNLSTHEGQVAFKERVDNSGIYGFLTLLGLQFAQIFLVILPGEPLEVLAGMCFTFHSCFDWMLTVIFAIFISKFTYINFFYDYCGCI